MSPALLARLRQLQRDTERDRSNAFGYYARELKMGRRRAAYYTARVAYYSPLELAQRGY